MNHNVDIYFLKFFNILLLVPGQAKGGSFRGERTNEPKKELAFRLRTGHQIMRCPNRILCADEPGGALVVAGCVSFGVR